MAHVLLPREPMRALLVCLVVRCVVTASAIAAPLSMKEVALMLRSGYSSESILREIASRHVLDPLDATTKKSMVEFGATPALISTLEGGTFAAAASEADQAKKKSDTAAALRAAEIEQEQRRTSQAQAEASPRVRAPSNPTQPIASIRLSEVLKEKLVRCLNGSIGRADGTELENKKLIAFYYSAHWCAPCRKFTPELVDYYNRVAPQHPEFEIVFVSFDHSRFNWETYVRETKMPWLAIDYDQVAALPGLRQLGGGSIPSLLVLDAGSHIVASSYQGDKYLGPQSVLEVLDQIFASKSGAPVARAR